MSIFAKFSIASFLFIVWSMYGKAELTVTETEVTLMLLSHFRGSICIYASDNSAQELSPVRSFSEHGNYFLYLSTMNELQDYVTGVRTPEQKSGKSLIVLKAGQEIFASLTQISNNTSLSSVIWIMYGNNPLNKTDFQGIYVPFDCEFIYVYERENIYILTEIYHIQKSSGLETINFGFWTKDNGLTIHEELFYRRRTGLNGFTFSALSTSVPPYITYKEKTPEEYEIGGYMYEVWKEIERRINIKVTFSKTNTNKNADLFNSGSDFAVLPIVYDSAILDYLDITHPIYESRSYLFGHRPGSELEWDSYLKPFDSQTWLATLAWMMGSSATLAFLYKISWSYGTSERETQYFIFTFPESFATVFRSMCNQGSNVTPRSNSCRLLFLSIYLTALVVNSAFSAALFSLLTVPTARAPFNNFEEVITNNAYTVGWVGDSSVHNILQDYGSKYPESIQKKLLKKVEYHYDTLLDGLQSVCHNKMSIVMTELPFVLYTMQNMTRDCQEKIMPAGPLLFKSFIGFGLRKGSPYKKLIDMYYSVFTAIFATQYIIVYFIVGLQFLFGLVCFSVKGQGISIFKLQYHFSQSSLLMMRNEGIIQRLLLRSWPPKIPSVQATWVRVTLSDISPILYMFGLGAILSLALLMLEKIKFLMFRKSFPIVAKAKSSVAKVPTPFSASKIYTDIDYYKTKVVHTQNFW